VNPVLANGGNTWSVENTGTMNSFLSLWFFDRNTGLVAGSSGTILKTTDVGGTWITMVSTTVNTLRAACAIRDDYYFTAGDGGTILRTSDLFVGIPGPLQSGYITLLLYPDPASDKITIKTDPVAGNIHISVFNSLGAEIITLVTSSSSVTLETGDLPSSIYFIRIGSGTLVRTGKFIRH